MPGINNVTNATMEQLEYMANSSSLPEFFVKVSTIVYGGWLWFIILCVVWFVLFRGMNQKRDQLLINGMYSGAVVTVLSFLLRAVTAMVYGVESALLTDHQLWVFPIVTLLLMVIVWATKD